MTIIRQTGRKKEWELRVSSGEKDVRGEAAEDSGKSLINACITTTTKKGLLKHLCCAIRLKIRRPISGNS